MSRSKDSSSFHYYRHERHVNRNGSSEDRYSLKKTSAANMNQWEALIDEVPDIIEEDSPHTVNNTSTKLCLVDPNTFQTMRHEQLS
ncbi:hypothetical protein G6F43_004236 [Rhizopus delemar]|nr:hypothetical protein G6F43_004236 [Rhizopus delemar]